MKSWNAPIRLFACLAGLCILCGQTRAVEAGFREAEGAIHTWRSADGLPGDSVAAILQTRDGFLWVGSDAGLVRFDGVKFTPIQLGATSTNFSASITALCEDGHGRLWIGSQHHGLFVLEQGQVRQYTTTNGLLNDSVTSLAVNGHGRVWIGTKTGLNLFNGERFESFTTRDGLTDGFVSGVHVARSGTVWITTRGGMCRYLDGHIAPYALQTESLGRSPEYLGVYEDRRGNLWAFGDTYLINLAEGKRFNYFRGNEATSVRIWSLCEGRDGRIWIGTSGRGLFCFEDNRFQPVILGELRWPYDVRAICEDREGNLWLGTSGGGLVQLRPQRVQVMRVGQGLPGSSPTALAMDAIGRVYLGLARGGLFASEGDRFERFGGASGLEVQDFVSSLCVAPNGTLWAGTLGSGLYALRNGRSVQFTTADGLADNLVLSVCADHDGNIWASTASGTLHRFSPTNNVRYDRADGLPDSPVTLVTPAAQGGLWLGTENGSILSGVDGEFHVVQFTGKPLKRPVIAMYEADSGHLWIGTAGGGLACLAGGMCAGWDTELGLPDDTVAGIAADESGNLWLSTGAGIYRISQSALEKSLSDSQTPLDCKRISDAQTGPEPMAAGGTRILVAPKGRLWFSTSDGVLNVDTRRTEVASQTLPVFMESASFNERPSLSLLRGVSWASAFTNDVAATAPGDLRSLEVHFTALSFASPDKTRFRHRLEGFDADWVNDGTTRLARYGKLPYGHYRFRVEACVADGPWQEADTVFAFEVPTPFYLESWAIVLYGIAAIAFVAGVVRVVSHRRLRHALAQLEQQQILERERMRIARDMHDEMGSKLTKISFLSEHARVDATSDGPLGGKIESIAEASRDLLQTMDEIVWVVNPHNDNLEHLAAYLGHYADEYFQNTSVECELRLPQTIAHFPLSSETRHNLFLAFEEALNNVLKHSGASNVKVAMSVNGPRFEIVISDNGSGFVVPPESSGSATQGGLGGRRGNGLRNMRQRLSSLAGECLIHSQTGVGTTVTLRIRLNATNKQ